MRFEKYKNNKMQLYRSISYKNYKSTASNTLHTVNSTYRQLQ